MNTQPTVPAVPTEARAVARLSKTLPARIIYDERVRAHNKHKARDGSMESKPWDHHIWLPVLTEELGEIARVICDTELGIEDTTKLKLTEEVTQLAAMATAWLAALIE